MDETREILFQRQVQRGRGEHFDDGMSLEEMLVNKAKAVRIFYEALLSNGFSEQAALQIVVNNPI